MRVRAAAALALHWQARFEVALLQQNISIVNSTSRAVYRQQALGSTTPSAGTHFPTIHQSLWHLHHHRHHRRRRRRRLGGHKSISSLFNVYFIV